MRERLIEILKKTFGEQYEKRRLITLQHTADYLLANGVIVPPCKAGDTVWFDTWEKNGTINIGIQPHQVDQIDVVLVCGAKKLVPTKIYDWKIGKTVFLTKEEAEKALKGEN